MILNIAGYLVIYCTVFLYICLDMYMYNKNVEQHYVSDQRPKIKYKIQLLIVLSKRL